MKRCFVAMDITAPARRSIAAVQDALMAGLPPHAARRVRPVAPESLHLTIDFLGATAERQVPDVVAALEGVAQTMTRPTSPPQIAGIGAFPSPRKPRAIFADIRSERDTLIALCHAVEGALEPLGFAAEERARAPHITIVRVDRARPNGFLSDWITANRDTPPFGAVAAHALVLYESELAQGGSRYTPLATLPLAPPRTSS